MASRQQNTVPIILNIIIGNLSFENVEEFKYPGATIANIKHIREEILFSWSI